MRIIGSAILVLLVGCSGAAQASSCRASLAEYRALGKGQTLASVIRRIGCRGRKVADVSNGRQRRVDYAWRGEGRFGANVTLTFVNGRLTDKFELGLD